MAARVALQGKKLTKTGLNKFAGYKYFELGDFLPEIQNIFNDLGLCGVVSYGVTEATLCITDVDDGTIIVISSPMAAAELKGAHPIQNLGAVETYQRRYLWMTAMEIVEHDVLDASKPAEVKEERPKVSTFVPRPHIVQAPAERVKGDTLPPPYKETNPEWTITIHAEDADDHNKLLLSATKLKLSYATSEEQVKEMFKVNRELYSAVKTSHPEVYDEVMDMFKENKAKFKDQ